MHYVDYVLQALIWNNISRHCTNPHLHIWLTFTINKCWSDIKWDKFTRCKPQTLSRDRILEKLHLRWKWVNFTLKLCKPTYEKILVFKKCLPYTRLDVIENIHFLLDLSNTNPDFLINYFTKSSSLRKHSKDKEAVLVH